MLDFVFFQFLNDEGTLRVLCLFIRYLSRVQESSNAISELPQAHRQRMIVKLRSRSSAWCSWSCLLRSVSPTSCCSPWSLLSGLGLLWWGLGLVTGHNTPVDSQARSTEDTERRHPIHRDQVSAIKTQPYHQYLSISLYLLRCPDNGHQGLMFL